MPTLRLSLAQTLFLATTLSLTGVAPRAVRAREQHPAHPAAQVSDSAAVAATVRAFHHALQVGDSAAVQGVLTQDLRVAESGGIETYEEYLSHHLPGDMAFAAAVTREPVGPTHVTVVGDVAWVMSGFRTTGTFRDRTINSVGAELMVLGRDGASWRIRAIHWSSRQAR